MQYCSLCPLVSNGCVDVVSRMYLEADSLLAGRGSNGGRFQEKSTQVPEKNFYTILSSSHFNFHLSIKVVFT